MATDDQAGADRVTEYPPEERGRRVLWRTVTIGLFLALGVVAYWLADRNGWSERLTLAAVAIPYWVIVTVVWSKSGPYMPRLHGPRGQDGDKSR